MKKVAAVTLAMAMLMFTQLGFAADKDKFRGCDPKAAGKGEFKLVKAIDKNTAVYSVTFDPYQLTEEKLAKPNWEISVSYHALFDGKWVYVQPKEADNYAVKTTQQPDGSLEFTMNYSGSDVGVYNPRVWGKDKNTGKWLWINRNSQFCRNSEGGYQAYESVDDLVNNTHVKAVEPPVRK